MSLDCHYNYNLNYFDYIPFDVVTMYSCPVLVRLNSVVYSFVAASQTDPSCASFPSHPHHLVLDHRLDAAVDHTIDAAGVVAAPGNNLRASPPGQLHHRPFDAVVVVVAVAGAVDARVIVEAVLDVVLAGFY